MSPREGEQNIHESAKNKKIGQQNLLRSHLGAIGLERFFSRSNVAFYRGLANKKTSAAKRREILRLLEEEQVKFRLEFKRAAAEADQP